MSNRKTEWPSRPKSKWVPYDYCMEYMRKNKRASYGEVKNLAMPRRWRDTTSFPPIVYGRVLAILGLVPVKPRRKARKAA
jgi:hypothetical protein